MASASYKEKNEAFYRIQYFIDDQDLNIIRAAGEQIMGEMRTAYDQLYDWMRKNELYREFFTEDLITGISSDESVFWDDVVLARLSDRYIQTQTHYGVYFSSAGLPLEAFTAILVAFHEFIRQAHIRLGVHSFELMSSFKKFTAIPIDIVTEVYKNTMNNALHEQNRALMELSTPATQLWGGILFLPLVGFIDSKRAQDTMSKMLEMIAAKQAKVFILDISGIAVVDTAVANHLIKMSKASKLMGCLCIISGVAGSVAQTIVELGINIDEIKTTGSMQDALQTALNTTGMEIERSKNGTIF